MPERSICCGRQYRLECKAREEEGKGKCSLVHKSELEDCPCAGGCPPTNLSENLQQRGVFPEVDGSLAPPHAKVDIEDVRFDLIAHPVLWELGHLQHV